MANHDERDRHPGDPTERRQGQPGGCGDESGNVVTGDERAGDERAVGRPEQNTDFDADYHQWRAEQMRALDDDYHTWRQDRYKKFSEEFSSWRNKRMAASAAGGTDAGDLSTTGDGSIERSGVSSNDAPSNADKTGSA